MNKFSSKLKNLASIFRLFEFIAPYRLTLILVFVGSVFATLLSLVPTYIIKPLVDRVLVPALPTTMNERIITLHFLIILLIVVYVIETLIKSVLEYNQSCLNRRIAANLRRRLYAHLQKISLKFYNLEKTASLHSIVCYDTQAVPYFFVYDLVKLFILAVMFFGMGVVLFSLEWRLALLLFIPAPLFIIISHRYGMRLNVYYRKIFKKMADMSTIVFDAIKGIIVVKTNVTEERELRRFEKANADYVNEALRSEKLNFLYLPTLGFILFFSTIFIRWFGGLQVIKEELSLGALMVFIGYMWQFYGPVSGINSIYRKIENTLAASERVFKVLDIEPEVDYVFDAIALPRLKGEVRFNNISFTYDGKKNVLNNFNLEAHPGEIIGIVGQSGAGKTTLMYLLYRLFKPATGAIFVDGYDIQKVRLESLRTQIGIVLQEVFLFYGTIAENIAYAEPSASRIEIINAAKAAGAHEFIMLLPDAYDTLLGEGGITLSTGERQRISIARVLLKNPRIVIFDEATVSVDLISQEIILATIRKLKEENCTIFVISYQLSMMEITDRLIFLDQGNIIESGGCLELIHSGGALSHFIEEKFVAEMKKRSLDFYVL